MEKILTSNTEWEFKTTGQQFVCELKTFFNNKWPSYIFDPLLVFCYVQLRCDCDINHMASISIQTTSDSFFSAAPAQPFHSVSTA